MIIIIIINNNNSNNNNNNNTLNLYSTFQNNRRLKEMKHSENLQIHI